MKRLMILLAAATTLTAPAIAQHHGHPPGHSMPMPKAKPAPKARKAPAKAKPAARPKATAKPKPKKAAAKPVRRKAASKPAAKKPAAKPAADPHAGHEMPVTPPPVGDPHAGHDMGDKPAQPAGPHAGHDMGATPAHSGDPHAGHDMGAAPAQPVDPHAGHDMGATPADPHAGHGAVAAPAPPTLPAPPGAFSGPAHAADTVWNPAEMAEARAHSREEHGGMETYKVLVDQLEAKLRDGRDGYAWDAQAWYGGDINKLWLKSEGEGSFGRSPEAAEVQALWSRAIDPWFDLQAGIRYDIQPNPERAHLVLGVQGLAPYWFEVDAAAFLSNKGDLTARIEAEYDLRLTQRLILQPRVEFDLAAQDVPELGIGSGLSTGELGARLRYEIRPEFAPYIGVEYERAFGDTAGFRRAEGEDAGGWSLLLGLRTWF